MTVIFPERADVLLFALTETVMLLSPLPEVAESVAQLASEEAVHDSLEVMLNVSLAEPEPTEMADLLTLVE